MSGNSEVLGNILRNIDKNLDVKLDEIRKQGLSDYNEIKNVLNFLESKLSSLREDMEKHRKGSGSEKSANDIKTSYGELNARIQFLEEDIEKLTSNTDVISKQFEGKMSDLENRISKIESSK